MWTKDGVGVQYDSIYTRHQYLLNGSDAKYHSFLSASAAPENLIGEYACIVRDSLGPYCTDKRTQLTHFLFASADFTQLSSISVYAE